MGLLLKDHFTRCMDKDTLRLFSSNWCGAVADDATGPPASDYAGIYESCHCVSAAAAADNGPLSLCILFFSFGLTATPMHTHAHTHEPGFRQLPAVLKTAKQEQCDLLFLSHTSCSFLRWRETSSWLSERAERSRRLRGMQMNRSGSRGDGDGGVHVTRACVCVCAVRRRRRRRRCAERMWPEVMGKQLCCGGQALTAHIQNHKHFI